MSKIDSKKNVIFLKTSAECQIPSLLYYYYTIIIIPLLLFHCFSSAHFQGKTNLICDHNSGQEKEMSNKYIPIEYTCQPISKRISDSQFRRYIWQQVQRIYSNYTLFSNYTQSIIGINTFNYLRI